MNKRVALYVRTSTVEQRQDLQLDELRESVIHRGWVISNEYTDIVSGSKDRRPGLDRLMQDARRRRFDVVAVWRLDRLGRSVLHLLRSLEEFDHLGIDFISLHEALDTSTPQGRLLFVIIGGVAQMERELIRERTVSGLRAARRRGVHLGRKEVTVDTALMLDLRQRGFSLRAIGHQLGVPKDTVARRLRTMHQSSSC